MAFTKKKKQSGELSIIVYREVKIYMRRIKLWSEDINLIFIGIYVLISIVLIVFDCLNITGRFPKYSFLRLPQYSVFEMMTFHIQTMCLVSTVLGYLISKVDSRIMGLSIKYWMLKRKVYSLNISTWFLQILITGGFAVLGFALSARYFLIINWVLMLLAIIRIIYFAYLISSKRSMIYRKMMDGIRRSKGLRESIFEKWECYPFYIEEQTSSTIDSAILVHNSYIVEELSLLQLLMCYTQGLTEDNKNTVKRVAVFVLSKDSRNFEEVRRILQKYSSNYLSSKEAEGFMEWLAKIPVRINS